MALLAAPGTASAHQPHDPVARVAASPDFARDGTLFVATKKTTQVPGARMLLRSTDGGASFAPSHRGLPNWFIQAIAVSPAFAEDRTVLAATCKGLFVSRSGGDRWEPSPAFDAGGPCVLGAAFSPSDRTGKTIYLLARERGVLASDDGGRSFAARPRPGGGGLTAIAFLPGAEGGEQVAVGTEAGVFFSADRGRTWTPAGAPLDREPVTALAADRAPRGALFAAGLAGVFRSADGGRSWTAVAALTQSAARSAERTPARKHPAPALPQGLPRLVGPIMDLALLPAEGGATVVAATVEAVWIGREGGARWGLAEKGLREADTLAPKVPRFEIAVVAEREGGRSLFVGGWEGLHLSLDGGASFRHVELIRPYSARGVAVSPRFAEDGTLVVSTYGSGAYRSTDGGASWHDFNRGLAYFYLDPVAFAPAGARGNPVFVGGLRGLAWREAGADRWTMAQPALAGRCPGEPAASMLKNPNEYVRSLAFSPAFAEDGEIWAGAEGGCVFRSRDAGRSWQPVHGAGSLVMDLRSARGPTGTTWWLAGLDGGGIVASRDGGSFAPLGNLPRSLTVPSLAASPGFAADGLLLAGTFESGLMVSRDRGATWTRAPGFPPVPALKVAVSPGFSSDGTVFVATDGAGVLHSRDGGRTWNGTGFAEPLASDLALSPDFPRDGVILAGGLTGPHLSRDGGRTFRPVLDRVRYRAFSADVRLEGAWEGLVYREWGGMRAVLAVEPGSRLDFWFVGRGIAWIGDRGPRGGRASLRLDGGVARTVDLRDDEAREGVAVWSADALAPGAHHLEIEVAPRPETPGASEVVVESFEVALDRR